MKTIIQKFGGTSVGTTERIRNVARHLMKTRQEGNGVVGIISAMAGETNRLVQLGTAINPAPWSREYDMLLAAGEQQAVALVALAVNAEGGRARPLLAHQVGIRTDSLASNARIREIDTHTIRSLLAEGTIPVIAGFQGVDADNNITTLGRGGSDTSAVAIAAALKADDCEIFTDVEGVYTTDPRLCSRARKLSEVRYDEMIELASLGTKVLQIRSVELAANYRVPLHVRSSFNQVPGTRIVGETTTMETCIVRGIAAEHDTARVILSGIPDQARILADIFGPLSEAGIVVDGLMRYQGERDTACISFTVQETLLDEVKHLLRNALASRYSGMRIDSLAGLAKISLVGVGIRNHPEITAKTFRVLEDTDVAILHTTTSEIKVSVFIDRQKMQVCVERLHDAFGLAG